MTGLVRIAACAALGLALAAAASAENRAYPTRPIRLIVGFPPGGSTDLVARALQPKVEQLLGQPFVVDNRPGAGGVIGIDAVAKAAPDGYVIGLGAAGALAVNVSLQEQLPYDPLRDLAPVTLLAEVPFVLVASPSVPAHSLAEVIAFCRRAPDAASIGFGGNGTAMHLAALLFNHMAGLTVTLVPYRGSGPVATDVLAGHIPFGIVDIPSALALVRAGRIDALAVSAAHRVVSLPDVPTFAEAGLPGYESVGWFGIVAPAGTPPDITGKLNQALVTALTDADIQDRIRSVGAEPAPGTPEQFGQFIRAEIAKWAKVVVLSGAKEH